MSSDPKPRVREVLPSEAWGILEGDPSAVLVDVRTRSEWAYVGLPDISQLGRQLLLVEWVQLPNLSLNPYFVGEVIGQLGDETPGTLLFICRSGVRSLKAAAVVQAHLDAQGQMSECINVATGFEGDLDESHHRGTKNGWKVEGLPWRQS
jgi:rhodanese-related sulfurtransferase